jgi:hypothetical protein
LIQKTPQINNFIENRQKPIAEFPVTNQGDPKLTSTPLVPRAHQKIAQVTIDNQQMPIPGTVKPQ